MSVRRSAEDRANDENAKAARRAFSANLLITKCDAVSRHRLMPTVGAMRRGRFYTQTRPRVRLGKSLPLEFATVSRPLSAAVSFVVSFAGIRERPLRLNGNGLSQVTDEHGLL